ncbi:fibrinogen gamma chain-like [Drosophila busckii]|uniref:fibrinogen gamma chain-like n=1 Tax=Drosophila busckii TaxID=30019 RepID=UPI0014329BC9|nr:fibrinogen gamma chain-like [Drosophila busckii]XP_033150905.1 fibrinogen gamma chain-like [Drosophila busckii]
MKLRLIRWRSTIKNLQANGGCFERNALLYLALTEDELGWGLTKIHKLKRTITTLKATNNIDCKIQMRIDATERNSCVFGNVIQTIRVPGAEPFQVPCDSQLGGWTVIQRRMDGSVSFNRTWEEYRNGFGDLRTDFWLGLEKLYLMMKFQSTRALHTAGGLQKRNNDMHHYSNFFSWEMKHNRYELLSLGDYTLEMLETHSTTEIGVGGEG